MTEEKKKKNKDTSSAEVNNSAQIKYSATISSLNPEEKTKQQTTATAFANRSQENVADALAKLSAEEKNMLVQQVMMQAIKAGAIPNVGGGMANNMAGAPGQKAPGPLKINLMQNLMKFFDIVVHGIDKSLKYIANSKNESIRTEVLEYTRPPAIFGVWVSIITLGFFFGWGSIAPINQATIAQGFIVLESQKRVIQHPEGGIIDKIYVTEGEYVTKGQPLLQLSPTMSKASRDDAFNKYMSALAEHDRLIAQRDNLDKINFDNILLNNAGNEEISKMMETQNKIFVSTLELIKDNVDSSLSKINQLNQQVIAYKSSLESLNRQLDNTQKDYDALKKLNESKQFASHADLRRADSNVANISARIAEIGGNIAGYEEAIKTEEIRIHSIKNDFLNKTVEAIKQNQRDLVTARESYTQAEDRFKRTTILSPVTGIVGSLFKQQQFSITDGGVLQPNFPIMEIVPTTDHLIVEVNVEDKDIDTIKKGQTAYCVVTAFKSRVVPKLKGKVISVSPDVIMPRHGGEKPHYVAKIELDQNELDSIMKNKEVKLYPGMMVQAFIEVGPRTLLRYLLDPLLMTMDVAFREK